MSQVTDAQGVCDADEGEYAQERSSSSTARVSSGAYQERAGTSRAQLEEARADWKDHRKRRKRMRRFLEIMVEGASEMNSMRTT